MTQPVVSRKNGVLASIIACSACVSPILITTETMKSSSVQKINISIFWITRGTLSASISQVTLFPDFSIWHKSSTGHIRTICLRHITGGSKPEVIVGTSEGDVRAYNANGKLRWSMHLDDNIVDAQTGFIARRQQEEIIICSSDHHVYILS